VKDWRNPWAVGDRVRIHCQFDGYRFGDWMGSALNGKTGVVDRIDDSNGDEHRLYEIRLDPVASLGRGVMVERAFFRATELTTD